MSAVDHHMFEELRYTPEGCTFALNAPGNVPSVKVRIYESADALTPVRVLEMLCSGTDHWRVSVDGDWHGYFYTFDIGRGECPGTFAKAVGVNGKRAAIVRMEDTNPDGWEYDVRPKVYSPSDLVVYELHYRDFSVHPSLQSHYPGKYLALAEPRSIWYLKTLGINAVQLMPSFDFSSVNESLARKAQYNWGYDPLNYNVPEGSYSTDANIPETRIREFKQMVQALHSAGIRVIMDVVYNHCANIEGSNFQLTYPDYYYRKKSLPAEKVRSGSVYANGSGCGNETASERPLMRQFMVESVRYWVEEYHIDGFRFDLMGIHDIETMTLVRKELDKIDPSITVYGEGWAASSPAIDGNLCAMKANAHRLPGIGVFGDEMRDALRGPFSIDTQAAFLSGKPGFEESIKFGLVGAIAHNGVDMSKVNYSNVSWAVQPSQHISYVSCHDDLGLVDRLRVSMPGVSDKEVVRLSQLAHTCVLVSQGIPFLWAGEEALRDKKRVRNSYNRPDSVNRIDWNRLKAYPELFLYFRGLIDIRKHHKAFRMGDARLVRQNMCFLNAPSCVIGFVLDGAAVGDPWSKIVCVINGNRTSRKVSVPEGTYTIVCSDGMVCADGLGKIYGGKVDVASQSALIMYSDR